MRSKFLDKETAGARSSALAARLDVISGLHAGVSVPLEQRRYCIGSALSADIVLHDAGVVPEHAIIQVERRSLRLEATGGDVGLPNGQLPKGNGSYLRFPAELRLGEATIRVFLPKDAAADEIPTEPPRPSASRRRRRIPRRVVLSIALCLAGGVPLLAMSTAKPDANATAPLPSTTLGAVATDRLTKDKLAELPRIEEVLRDLTTRIDKAGLQTLTAAVTDGRLTVTGTLDKRDAETWIALQQWFDQTYGRQIILGANVSIAEGRAAAPLRLQAAWYGANPYVIAADGAHYYEGSKLDSGWVIRKIDADRTLLVRNGESLALSYQ